MSAHSLSPFRPVFQVMDIERLGNSRARCRSRPVWQTFWEAMASLNAKLVWSLGVFKLRETSEVIEEFLLQVEDYDEMEFPLPTNVFWRGDPDADVGKRRRYNDERGSCEDREPDAPAADEGADADGVENAEDEDEFAECEDDLDPFHNSDGEGDGGGCLHEAFIPKHLSAQLAKCVSILAFASFVAAHRVQALPVIFRSCGRSGTLVCCNIFCLLASASMLMHKLLLLWIYMFRYRATALLAVTSRATSASTSVLLLRPLRLSIVVQVIARVK